MKCSNVSFCKNALPDSPVACYICERTLYCCSDCNLQNVTSHSINCNLLKACDIHAKSRLNETTRTRIMIETKNCFHGHRLYLRNYEMKSKKEKNASTFLIFPKWTLLYIQVIQKLDTLAASEYGIVSVVPPLSISILLTLCVILTSNPPSIHFHRYIGEMATVIIIHLAMCNFSTYAMLLWS